MGLLLLFVLFVHTLIMAYLSTNIRKVTTLHLAELKSHNEKISMLTCYDYSMAQLLDAAGIDAILVGDSAANVMAGHSTTLPITLDEMITYASGVVRGVRRALVVVDLPFGYYQGNPQLALASAVRIMKETGADAVKLEGGREVATIVQTLTDAGIPVMGHLGLTPQSVHALGGYGLQAKTEAQATKLEHDALQLQAAGCFALVAEKIPATLAKKVANQLHIPVIGIGAGPDVDGQVLVLQDMLGITQNFTPKFLRQYANLGTTIQEAVKHYISDVKEGDFPAHTESY